jgi:hypothetical protein
MAFRYTKVPGSDNKHLFTSKENQSPAYNANVVIQTTAEQTTVWYAPTGATSFTATGLTNTPYQGDKLKIMFAPDGSADHIMTFSTGFNATGGTVTVDSDNPAAIEFTFDGTNWVETGRAVGA